MLKFLPSISCSESGLLSQFFTKNDKQASSSWWDVERTYWLISKQFHICQSTILRIFQSKICLPRLQAAVHRPHFALRGLPNNRSSIQKFSGIRNTVYAMISSRSLKLELGWTDDLPAARLLLLLSEDLDIHPDQPSQESHEYLEERLIYCEYCSYSWSTYTYRKLERTGRLVRLKSSLKVLLLGGHT